MNLEPKWLSNAPLTVRFAVGWYQPGRQIQRTRASYAIATPMVCAMGLLGRALVVLSLLLAPVGGTWGDEAHPRPQDVIPVSGEYVLQNWGMSSGLPGNNIRGIAQSHDGYLWVATTQGLARFDGVNFTSMLENLGQGPRLNWASTAFVAHDGSFWGGLPFGGVVREQRNRWEWMRRGKTDPDDLFAVTSFSEDASGAVWAGCGTLARALRFEAGRITEFGSREGIGPGVNTQVYADSAGRIWYSTKRAFGIFNGQRFQRLDPLHSQVRPVLAPAGKGGMWVAQGEKLFRCDAEGIKEEAGDLSGLGGSQELSCLHEGSGGDFWIGTQRSGLFRLKEGKFSRVPVSHCSVSVIAEDREGNLWVGTNGAGLDRLRVRSFFLRQSKEGLSDDQALSLSEDAGGTLWIAGRNGAPVRALDGSNQKFSPLSNWPEGALPLALCAEPGEGMWVATISGGILEWKENGWRQFLKGKITSMIVDREGTLWAGSIDGPLIESRQGQTRLIPTDQGLHHIRALALDNEGCLWAGTEQGRVFRIESGQIRPVPLPDFLEPFKQVRFILPDGPGTVWMGLGDGGLFRWKEGKVSYIPRWMDSPMDDFRSLLIDRAGDFWIGTRSRLLRVARSELEAVLAGKKPVPSYVFVGPEEGVPSMEYSVGFRRSAIQTRDGHLWFATYRGALEIVPELLRQPVAPAPVQIEQMSVGANRILIGEGGNPRLSPHPGPVQIRFTQPSMNAPEQIGFRYRLLGLSDQWVCSERQRVVNFASLAPGSYRLEVEATAAAQPSIRTLGTLEFSVEAAWWETGAFRILAGVLGTTALALLVRFIVKRRMRARMRRLEQEHALERERSRIARDMHDELGASLTRITLMSELAAVEAQSAEPAADCFSAIARETRAISGTLDEIVWTVNPRNDTLERLVGYLGEFTNEFLAAAGLEYHLEMPSQLPALVVGADTRHHILLALKEALNNAVKYARASKVTVRVVCREEDQMRIMVEDDGCGFDLESVASTSNGLANMNQRMVAVGGHAAIASQPGKGTRITFEFPVRKAP